MSHLNVTKPAAVSVLDAERKGFARFASDASDPVYRQVMAELYRRWHGINEQHFRGQLKEPHITIGTTPPRSLGVCKPLTDWGGQLQITINQRVGYGGSKMVVNLWPARGTKRFIEDIVLHESIHQFHCEITGKVEPGYRGHGPEFTKICNDIGDSLGLPAVVPRRRGKKYNDSPVCTYWPHNVRPDGYYEPDIRLGGIAGGRAIPRRRHVPDWAVVFDTFLAFIEEGRIDELKRVLRRELAKIQTHDGAKDCNIANDPGWQLGNLWSER